MEKCSKAKSTTNHYPICTDIFLFTKNKKLQSENTTCAKKLRTPPYFAVAKSALRTGVSNDEQKASNYSLLNGPYNNITRVAIGISLNDFKKNKRRIIGKCHKL